MVFLFDIYFMKKLILNSFYTQMKESLNIVQNFYLISRINIFVNVLNFRRFWFRFLAFSFGLG